LALFHFFELRIKGHRENERGARTVKPMSEEKQWSLDSGPSTRDAR
jgi:hypothetical protein